MRHRNFWYALGACLVLAGGGASGAVLTGLQPLTPSPGATPPAGPAQPGTPPSGPALAPPEPAPPLFPPNQPAPDQESEPLSLTSVENVPETAAPQMLGDLPPTLSSFKIADGESPRPQDRFNYGVNYFNNIAVPAHIPDLSLVRETLGLEQGVFDNQMSIGLRVPIDSATAAGLSSTAFGDLSFILKGILLDCRDTGVLLSGGLAVTVPTAPTNLVGVPHLTGLQSVALQPYAGYLYTSGNWDFLGFTSIGVPIDPRDVLLVFNDAGVRYALYQSDQASRFLTRVVPTVEVHVNTPLNHREPGPNDLVGFHDLVDLTLGVDLEFFRRLRLLIGFVTPVTGPKPVPYEVLSQLKVGF